MNAGIAGGKSEIRGQDSLTIDTPKRHRSRIRRGRVIKLVQGRYGEIMSDSGRRRRWETSNQQMGRRRCTDGHRRASGNGAGDGVRGRHRFDAGSFQRNPAGKGMHSGITGRKEVVARQYRGPIGAGEVDYSCIERSRIIESIQGGDRNTESQARRRGGWSRYAKVSSHTRSGLNQFISSNIPSGSLRPGGADYIDSG